MAEAGGRPVGGGRDAALRRGAASRSAAVEASPVRLRSHLHRSHRRDPLLLPDRDDDTVALHRFEHFEAELGLIRLDHEH
jgi:hypothetical protein